MQIPLIISLILSATTLPSITPTTHQELFQQSNSISFSKSKKTLKSIYLQSDKNHTFYCSCSFDTNKQIDHDSCKYSPRSKSNKRSQQLEFEHVVPAHYTRKEPAMLEETYLFKEGREKV
jgi:endonuclease I